MALAISMGLLRRSCLVIGFLFKVRPEVLKVESVFNAHAALQVNLNVRYSLKRVLKIPDRGIESG
jgi:hypothetical protein